MENIEKNTGILTKEFIKKLINREKELENEVFELNEKVKSLNTIKDTSNNEVPLGYNIFLNMIKYATINFNHDHNEIGSTYNYACISMPTISIADYPLNPDELTYISKIIENDRKPYIGMSDKIGTTVVDSYGKTVNWDTCDRLAYDRTWK